MRFHRRSGTHTAAATVGVVTLLLSLHSPFVASAAPTLVQLSSDPFKNSASQHKTEVEPDNFAYGSTIVNAFQTARVFGGGGSDIGWATSTDGGATWTHGFLPGTTIYAGGKLSAVSDPAVIYDARHGVWLISSLPIPFGSGGPGVIVNRSADGLTWSNPVVVSNQGGTDKDWITCDNTASSPFYGHCYVEWDNANQGDVVYMSTSSDGGQTWGPAIHAGTPATGLGGQPLVQPNGTVIVPFQGTTAELSFRSTDGGQTWSKASLIGVDITRLDPGGIRAGALPTAQIDGAGTVYVIWEDCRFEPRCQSNDLIMKTSTDGVTWSGPTRIPIGSVGSGADFFLPGLGIDRSTSGGSAHLGLVYYYYPSVSCTAATCQLNVGYVSSSDGGAHWSAPAQLAGPMSLSWLAHSQNGQMVGDYFSTAISGGKAYPVFAVANAPSGSLLDEAMYTVSGGLSVAGGTATSSGEQPQALSTDHPAPIYVTRH